MKRTLSWREFEVQLHDAYIDLDTLVQEGNEVRWRGTKEDIVRTSRGRPKVKLAYEARVKGVRAMHNDDRARVRIHMIREVVLAPGRVTLESGFDGTLTLDTDAPGIEVEWASQPVKVRRRLHWRTFDAARDGAPLFVGPDPDPSAKTA